MRHLVVAIAAVVSLVGCSSDAGPGDEPQGWQLLDVGERDVASQTNSNIGNPGTARSPSNNRDGETNNETPNNETPNNETPNNETPNNETPSNETPNNETPNNGVVDVGTPGADAGSGCTINSECAGDLVCCSSFGGTATCEADCFTGGLCGGDDGECPDDMECCDLGGIGGEPTCLQQCRTNSGGGSGEPCDTNPDCSAGEVCCPGFDGNGECSSQDSCFTGGACEQDDDCLNDQECCDFDFSKICLDRCSF